MVPTGIDKEKIALYFSRVEEYLRRLEALTTDWSADKDNFTVYTAIQRMLQITIEECLNIGSHLISGLGLKKADSYKEVFIRLQEAKLITAAVCQKMVDFAKFRNRLVHLYWEVNQDDIQQKLNETGYIAQYVKEISLHVYQELHETRAKYGRNRKHK